MEKEFLITPVEDGHVMFDDIRPKQDEYFYNSYSFVSKKIEAINRYTNFKEMSLNEAMFKIVGHTGISSLKNSELPLFEVYEPELKTKAGAAIDKLTMAGLNSPLRKRYEDIWIEGYKEAGGYTKDDMRKFAVAYHEWLTGTNADVYIKQRGRTHEEEIKVFERIKKPYQSLKNHPIAAVVEMIKIFDIDKKGGTTTDENKAPHGATFLWTPKVVKGRIQIKYFKY